MHEIKQDTIYMFNVIWYLPKKMDLISFCAISLDWAQYAGAGTWQNQSENTEEKYINLAADCLLVLLAALLSALVRFDAEAGPASGAVGLTSGAGGFLLVLEQLHQQFKLGTAVHLQSQTEQLVAALDTAGNTDLLRNKLRYTIKLSATTVHICELKLYLLTVQHAYGLLLPIAYSRTKHSHSFNSSICHKQFVLIWMYLSNNVKNHNVADIIYKFISLLIRCRDSFDMTNIFTQRQLEICSTV